MVVGHGEAVGVPVGAAEELEIAGVFGHTSIVAEARAILKRSLSRLPPHAVCLPQPRTFSPRSPLNFMDEPLSRLHAQSTLGDLPAHELALELATRGEVLAALFERHPGLPGVVVTEGGLVRGVLSRGQYLRLVSRYLGHEVYHPRPIRHMFDAVATLEEPLVLDAATPIQEAVAFAVLRPRALLYEPVIVRHAATLRLVDFPDLLLADSKISALRNQQMRQILTSVQEGFLLVDRDDRVAAEYSAWLSNVFGPGELGGRSFAALLASILGEDKAALGHDYLQTLFDPNVMERWVADINPLKKTEATVGGATRHLAFRFVRSVRQGRIDRILVRIEDRSREVELARELAVQEEKARERVDLVFALLNIETASLAAFLASFDQALALATRQLAGTDAVDERLRALARNLHGVKGEAGLLGLGRLAQEIHGCEDQLAAAQKAPRLEAAQRAALEASLAGLGKGPPRSAPPSNSSAGSARSAAAGLARLPPRSHRRPRRRRPQPRRTGSTALARQIEELAGRLGKEARFVSRVREEEIPAHYRPLVDKALVQLGPQFRGARPRKSRRAAARRQAGGRHPAVRAALPPGWAASGRAARADLPGRRPRPRFRQDPWAGRGARPAGAGRGRLARADLPRWFLDRHRSRPRRRPRGRPRPGQSRGRAAGRPHSGAQPAGRLLRLPDPAAGAGRAARNAREAGMKLLIVDDSLIVRNAIGRCAEASRLTEVWRAEDGQAAVELFALHRPQLVTMDLTMPRLDGLSAIQAIRALEPQTSILVISALNSHKTALEAIRRGACGFLTKPFTEKEVAEALDDLILHASGAAP